MKLIKPSYTILTPLDGNDILKRIEVAGRICYLSDDKIVDKNLLSTEDSAKKFVKAILTRGHESVIEHVNISVKFIVDRGFLAELTRHRLCSYSVESTRYCNYKGGVTFIIPPWLDLCPGDYTGLLDLTDLQYFDDTNPKDIWFLSMLKAEKDYIQLLNKGWTPQQARGVLPNALKTEIVATANLREWRHILKLRCSPAAHPQMQEIMKVLLKDLQYQIPIIFDDIKL